MVRILQICGCVREGLFREHVYKNGKYYDVVILGTIKKDWNKIKKRLKNVYEME